MDKTLNLTQDPYQFFNYTNHAEDNVVPSNYTDLSKFIFQKGLEYAGITDLYEDKCFGIWNEIPLLSGNSPNVLHFLISLPIVNYLPDLHGSESPIIPPFKKISETFQLNLDGIHELDSEQIRKELGSLFKRFYKLRPHMLSCFYRQKYRLIPCFPEAYISDACTGILQPVCGFLGLGLNREESYPTSAIPERLKRIKGITNMVPDYTIVKHFRVRCVVEVKPPPLIVPNSELYDREIISNEYLKGSVYELLSCMFMANVKYGILIDSYRFIFIKLKNSTISGTGSSVKIVPDFEVLGVTIYDTQPSVLENLIGFLHMDSYDDSFDILTEVPLETTDAMNVDINQIQRKASKGPGGGRLTRQGVKRTNKYGGQQEYGGTQLYTYTESTGITDENLLPEKLSTFSQGN